VSADENDGGNHPGGEEGASSSSAIRRRDFFRSASSRAASTISIVAAGGAASASSRLPPAAAATAPPVDPPADPAHDVPYSRVYEPAPHSMDGKLVLITGGNAGLGLESAKRLAEAGASVVFTSRDAARGGRALGEANGYLAGVRASDPNFAGGVAVARLDLCDLRDVASFRGRLAGVLGNDAKIDVLMNNAGVMAVPDRRLTADGYETTFQTNHLGHFALTSSLMPMLSPRARVINVASAAYQFAQKGLELDNLNGERKYGPWSSYGMSKLENILFASELHRRARASGDFPAVSAFSLHPGAVQTDLARYLIGEEKFRSMKGGEYASWTDRLAMEGLAKFVKTVQEGASTQVYLAASTDVVGRPECGGAYFSDGRVAPLRAFASDRAAAEELWAVSERLSGVKFDL
jgi:NAD(P)-dependent dehydrogenase (short-subunit alcohol dehydrogenase family)